MDGLALPWSDVPLVLIRRHALKTLAHGHGRGGERELWFLRRSYNPLLPIWHEGRLEIVRWGRRDGGLVWQRSIDSGEWIGAEPVEIRAAAGLQNGIWYRVHQGFRGLLVRDEAYVIIEPSSYYFRVMTRGDMMPVLIGERI